MKSISLSNKIALVTLIVTIVGIFFSILQSNKTINEEENINKTYGENSPIISNTDGNIDISYGKK